MEIFLGDALLLAIRAVQNASTAAYFILFIFCIRTAFNQSQTQTHLTGTELGMQGSVRGFVEIQFELHPFDCKQLKKVCELPFDLRRNGSRMLCDIQTLCELPFHL
jgi:hypothetical protein